MQTKVGYNSDVFFKFLFGRNTDASMFLRRFLLKCLLHIDMNDLSVDNPELILRFIEDRNIILDVYMNKPSIAIDIEMQKSLLSKYIYRRFQYYGARMIASQLEVGDDFYLMKDTYQIILIEDMNKERPRLIESYHTKESKHNNDYSHYVHTTIYVYLPYIEIIAQEKEELSEMEALLYLIHKGTLENIQYQEKKGVIQMAKELHNDFVGNRRLVEAMMRREEKRENFQLWHDMDVEEAKEVGKQEMLISIMEVKYPRENYDWIRKCSMMQLNKISKLLLTDISYADLKRRYEKR